MHPRVILFFGNFFFSIASTLSIYVLLPFLSTYMSEVSIGFVVAGGGAAAMILFPLLPRLEKRYGAQQLALVCATAEMLALLALAVAPGALAGSLFIIIVLALQPCISYGLDLLLEATSTERGGEGRLRTAFITAWNIGALAAPLLLAAVLTNSNEYGHIFTAAAAMLVPFIVLLAARSLPKGDGPELSHMKDTLICITRDRDLSAVTFAHLLLYLFYVWAPLYTPIYLHTELGIPWSSLGWMLSIMLIPYVLVEYPAGWLADKFIGDKELLLAGFLLAGISFASLGLLTPATSTALILFILVISRVGAALIESMTEGHFFRRVSRHDVNSISFFRSVWPLTNTLGPALASLILLFADYRLFFLITGGFLAVAGTLATLRIRDFR